MKKYVIHHAVIISLYIVLYFIFDWKLLQMINNAFLIGLIALVIFSSLKIAETGFLTLFTNGLTKLKQMIVPESNAMNRVEIDLAEDVNYQKFKKRKQRLMKYWLLIIMIDSFIISFIGLIFYG